MGLSEAQNSAERISNELTRARLLGTTPPTDEDIHEMTGEVMDASDECRACDTSNDVVARIGGIAPSECLTVLSDLIMSVRGCSRIYGDHLAREFIDAAKKS